MINSKLHWKVNVGKIPCLSRFYLGSKECVIRAGLFKVAGRLIMASIVNGGPGFPHFPSILYDYLISSAGETEQLLSTITKDDVVDLTVLEAIQKVYTFLTACRQCSIIILCILCNNTHGEVS